MSILASSAAGAAIGAVIAVAVIIFEIAALWKVFVKASRPGWGAIIPIYNYYLMCKVARRPGWWVILFFIPLVNIIILLLVMLDMAKAFGKGAGFGVGLWLLNFIFIPILGFGSAVYGGATPGAAPPAYAA